MSGETSPIPCSNTGGSVFSVVSFELFGQLHEVVGEEPGHPDAFFAECVRRWIQFVGIA